MSECLDLPPDVVCAPTNLHADKAARVTFKTRPELVRKLRAWEHEYNHRRLHLALGGKTPAERLAELRISLATGVLRTA